MSIPTLSPSYVFGLNSNVQSNAYFLDESTVLYPVGHQLIHYNFEKKTQKILNLPMDGDQISCMAINLSENLVAIGSKCISESGGAIIALFEINSGKRRKFYKTGDSTKEIVSVSFSSDGKYVFGQGGSPEWMIYALNVEKGKLVSSSKSTSGHLEIRKMSANPFDTSATHICVTGVNLFRLFRFQEGLLKLIHQMKIDHEIRAHSWISDLRVACGTIDSRILIFEAGELVSELQYLPALNAKNILVDDGPIQPSITAMASFVNGLFVGLENGTLLYYEKIEEHPFYRKKKEEAFEDSPITCITWNARDDRAVVTVKSNQIYLFQIENDQKGETIKRDRLSHSFHSGPILSIDVCLTKPLLASSGSDKSIRLWNYTENSLEVINFFEEPANCIAIHPNGLYILAGFPSAVRLMAILLDDIKTYWENPIKSARGCKFSHGGQYFAVITAINVTVLNTYSFETVAVIKVGSGRIHGIVWSDDDTRLVTYCTDGSMQQWSAFGFGKISEAKMDSSITSCALNITGNTSYTLTADGIVREIVNGVALRELYSKTPLKQLLLSNSSNIMLQSTESGSIRAVKYPFNSEGPIVDESVEYSFSESALRHIQLSSNSKYLFSAGEDGSLWIHRVQDKEGRKKDKDWDFTDEILVQKSDLRENYKYLNDLRHQVEDMKLQGDAAITNKDILHSSKEQDVYAYHEKDISAIQLVIEKVREETISLIEKNGAELQQLKIEHEQEAKDIRDAFLKKMEIEEEKYANLLKRRETLQLQWQDKMRSIQQAHKNDSAELSKFFAKQMEDKNDQASKLQQDRVMSRERHEQHLAEIEKDIEQESLEIMYTFETKLKEEKELFASVLADNNSMKTTFEGLQSQIEERKVELGTCATQNRKLAGLIKALENDVIGLKGEIRERDETILDKEKRIFDLKKKNQELEKFKFVLDFKIVELRKQEEPREKDIVALHQTLKLMKEEIKEVSTKKKGLDRLYEDAIMKNYGTQLHRNSECWKYNKLTNTANAIKEDLHQVMHSISSKNDMIRACISLFHNYRDLAETPGSPPHDLLPKYSESELLLALNNPGDDDVDFEGQAEKGSEDTRGRKQLEKTIQILKKEAIKTDQKRKKEAQKMLEEGTILTRELNALRKEIQDKRSRISDMENAFHKGTRLSQFLRNEISTRGTLILKTQEVHGEEIKSTVMPLPPILPPKDIL